MFCWQCSALVPDEAAFCTSCGAALLKSPGESAITEEEEQQVHALLAQANLLRLRRDFEGATSRCTEALKIHPANASAHSLLGDVCRDEERLRDAMEWYKLALTLDPRRKPDRDKLDLLIDQVYGTGQGQAQAAELVAETPSVDKAVARSRARLHFGAIALAGLALASVVVVILVTYILPKGETSENPISGVNLVAPSGAGGAAAPPLAGLPAPTSSKEQAAAPNESASATADDSFFVGLGDREQKLFNALSAAASQLPANVQIFEAQIEPRQRNAEIAFSFQGAENLEANKKQALNLALRLAKQAVQQEPGLESVTTKVYIQKATAKNAEAEVFFLGDLSAVGLRTIDPETISDQQTAAAFTNSWWNPTLPDQSQ